jgi:hypothetical protein
MADENTIDYPALCEELSDRVAELEAALSEEQDKNAVLVQQVVDAEDNIANREVESFADVIDAEDKEFFRERMIENREATLGLLNRMRTRKTAVTEVAGVAVCFRSRACSKSAKTVFRSSRASLTASGSGFLPPQQ